MNDIALDVMMVDCLIGSVLYLYFFLCDIRPCDLMVARTPHTYDNRLKFSELNLMGVTNVCVCMWRGQNFYRTV